MEFETVQEADSGGVATFTQSAPLRYNPVGFKHVISVSSGTFDVEVQGPGGDWTRYSSDASPAVDAGDFAEIDPGFSGLRVTCTAGAGTEVRVRSWQ
jgi:hypothetical protein